MRLGDFYNSDRVAVSLELFPPKTAEGMVDLFQNVAELMSFGPSFFTCTYGAGGSTRDKTLDIVERIHNEFFIHVAAHLTCVGATKEEIRAYLEDARRRHVDFIVALRGDPPQGEKRFVAVEGGFAHANELVEFIRQEFPDDFGIAVAGYPETHQEAPNRAKDLEYLKMKVDAGADIVITQLFYDNDDFYRFRDRCEAIGIKVPIIPGILPVTNLKQIQRISSLCGCTLPPELLSRLEVHAENAQGQFDVGVYHATRQVEDLVNRGGCRGIHFYCLNKSRAVATILRALTLPWKTVPHRG
ncbi:MAG TPA: methylenetetrahydrofolate reductase [NAD(P)H] [Candidatus Hydrogenedentes bacterium]|nr:methylenetetrahydrofolate reductase [NAD(P)H] [Candidatus Hydrogenedentota bacterium]HOL76242.1 methylenetetrahydrofolate reductase [NAD(P)H] [Candidatus Hydrogenedentota bacterium]HPO86781.1 methylenetetrahydrofolate reductase [NAD(P)H] [Candidatus Hydrogenedentota bacterium]